MKIASYFKNNFFLIKIPYFVLGANSVVNSCSFLSIFGKTKYKILVNYEKYPKQKQLFDS